MHIFSILTLFTVAVSVPPPFTTDSSSPSTEFHVSSTNLPAPSTPLQPPVPSPSSNSSICYCDCCDASVCRRTANYSVAHCGDCVSSRCYDAPGFRCTSDVFIRVECVTRTHPVLYASVASFILVTIGLLIFACLKEFAPSHLLRRLNDEHFPHAVRFRTWSRRHRTAE
eukprot:TRINITY_DN26130_c0_g1_i1.p1 TRINITY_DN26130_c0_g1~~TRINITY_DN26130_c0_g1_i1.p1  ORF type:complete len:169 (+),score=4.47 TRINITY_DN26130_c0_g1_i1:118-624(+)